jgi:hypothetical protein
MILLGWQRRGSAPSLNTAQIDTVTRCPSGCALICSFMRSTSSLLTDSTAPKSHNVRPLCHCADNSAVRLLFHRLLWAIPPIPAYLSRTNRKMRRSRPTSGPALVSFSRLSTVQKPSEPLRRMDATALALAEEENDGGRSHGGVSTGKGEITRSSIHSESGEGITPLITAIEVLARGVHRKAARIVAARGCFAYPLQRSRPADRKAGDRVM